MTEEPKPPSGRLERLLRHWGVEEASLQSRPAPLRSAIPQHAAAVPHPAETPSPAVAARLPASSPQVPPSSATPQFPVGAQRPGLVARWWPLAAGFILVLGAAALFIASQRSSTARSTEAKSIQAEFERLQCDMTQAKTDLETAHAALNEANKRVADANKRAVDADLLRARISELTGNLDAARASAAAALADEQAKSRARADQIVLLAAQVAESKKRADETQAQLTRAIASFTAREADLTAVRADFEKLRVQSAANQAELELAKARESAQAELAAQIAGATQAAQTTRNDTERRLAALNAERASSFTLLQSLYLKAAAPRESGLTARQTVARKNQLLRRIAALRPAVRSTDAGRVCDAVEVLLTRLDMLDPNSPQQVDAFGALLQSEKPVEQIDNVLLSTLEEPPVRAWLIETRLILMGV